MACELCGRGNCTRSFHSVEDQNNFDEQADEVKDRLRRIFSNLLYRAEYIDHEDEVWIKLSDAINIVENQD